jgi:curli biogenesis system outer membrane secretion channel CsgG
MSPLQLKRIKEPAKKLAVAVVDFQNKSGDPAFDKSTAKITGLMIDELLKTGKYKMVERERLNAVLGELKLNASGLVNPENAKRLGEQLGVDTLLFGNLTSVKYSRNKQTLFILWTEAQVTEAVLDARLVDVGTGSLLASSKSSASISQRQWIAFWFARLGKFAEKDSIVTDCIERACKQLANNLAAE